MDASSRARLRVLAAAALFATGGTAIKACALTSWQVAGFRSGLGALALWFLVPAARRAWSWRTGVVALPYAATLILYVLANKLTTAANTIFLQSTAPLYLLLVAPLLLRERIRRRELVFMAAMATGLTLFFVGFEAPQRTAPDPRTGNVLGALAGVAWALTIAGLRWLGRSEGGDGSAPAAAAGAVAGNALVFVVCLPMALPASTVRLADGLWVLYLGVVQIGLAYAFLTAGVRRVRAFEVSLLLLLEPVLNAGMAWGVHGEVPGSWSLLGSAVILLATAVHALRHS